MSKEKQYEKLLKEAVKIIHANCRNTDKDWLIRARAALREVKVKPKSSAEGFETDTIRYRVVRL